MAKPSSGWRGEPGGTCGWTWAKPLVVSGALPNGFGAHLSAELEPVVDEPFPKTDFDLGQPDVNLGELGVGFGGQNETRIRTKLLASLQRVRKDLEASSLPQNQRDMVRIALQYAQANLDAAARVHDMWDSRRYGGWPLSISDRLTNFYAAEDPKGDCTGNAGKFVDGRGRVSKVRCPTTKEIAQRPKDRRAIYQRYVDAAHWIRCAQYGLHRMTLYNQARREFEEEGVEPPVFTPKPKPGVTPGLDAPFTVQPPPEDGPAPPPPKMFIVPIWPPDIPIWPPDIPIGPFETPDALPIPTDAGPDFKTPTQVDPTTRPVQPSIAKAALGVAALGGLAYWAKSTGAFR